MGVLVLLGLSLNKWGNRDRERQRETVKCKRGVCKRKKSKASRETKKRKDRKKSKASRELRKGKTERER